MIFRLGTSPVRNTRSVHGECPCFHHGNPLEGLRPPGLDGDLLESFDGPGRVALLGRACDRQGSMAIFLNRSMAPAGSPFSVSKREAVTKWA